MVVGVALLGESLASFVVGACSLAELKERRLPLLVDLAMVKFLLEAGLTLFPYVLLLDADGAGFVGC